MVVSTLSHLNKAKTHPWIQLQSNAFLGLAEKRLTEVVYERGCLNENFGFPKCQRFANHCFQSVLILSPDPWLHKQSCVRFLFAHFSISIFEYPSDTQKIHGRKTKQDVEVNLTRTSIDNKNWAFLKDLLGIKYYNMREATEREVIVQLECLQIRKALGLVFDV